MAVALRAAGSRGMVVCGVPSGTTTGDVVVIVVSGNCTTSGAAPACAGFTLKDIIRVSGTTGRYIAVLVKKAVGAESGTYTLTLTGVNGVYAQAFSFTGGDTTGVTTTATDNASSTASPAVTLSGLAATDYVLWAAATSGGTNTVTMPGGWTEISTTSAAVGHVGGKIAGGTSVGPLTWTMGTLSTGRTAIALSIPEYVAPPANSAAFLALL